MSYGQVINGGAQMRKGLTKGINDKLDGFSKEQDRRAMLCDSVKKAFKGQDLSSPKVNDVQVGQKTDKFGGKKGNNFTITKSPKNV
tara:strand:- start:34 stop:291 length:258 start_codon:yes stop_codon:yes gene_type:complete